MKQRLLFLLSTLTLIALLSGCTPQQEKADSSLAKAELSEQEIKILELVNGKEPMLFDFTVEQGKSFTIQTFELQNGKWDSPKQYASSINPDDLPLSGRIAICQDEETGKILSIAVQGDRGLTRSSPTLAEEIPRYSARSTSSLSDRTEIQLDKPIALQVFYGYSENAASHTSYTPEYALEHPEEIDSEYAQIVTITFSDKTLS